MKLSTSVRKNHEALWNWLAKNPTAYKFEWPGFAALEQQKIKLPRNYCFLCVEYLRCKECPLKSCFTIKSLYQRWHNTRYPKTKYKLALQIANCFKKEGAK